MDLPAGYCSLAQPVPFEVLDFLLTIDRFGWGCHKRAPRSNCSTMYRIHWSSQVWDPRWPVYCGQTIKSNKRNVYYNRRSKKGLEWRGSCLPIARDHRTVWCKWPTHHHAAVRNGTFLAGDHVLIQTAQEPYGTQSVVLQPYRIHVTMADSRQCALRSCLSRQVLSITKPVLLRIQRTHQESSVTPHRLTRHDRVKSQF